MDDDFSGWDELLNCIAEEAARLSLV